MEVSCSWHCLRGAAVRSHKREQVPGLLPRLRWRGDCQMSKGANCRFPQRLRTCYTTADTPSRQLRMILAGPFRISTSQENRTLRILEMHSSKPNSDQTRQGCDLVSWAQQRSLPGSGTAAQLPPPSECSPAPPVPCWEFPIARLLLRSSSAQPGTGHKICVQGHAHCTQPVNVLELSTSNQCMQLPSMLPTSMHVQNWKLKIR